jgi:hypothetical protein
MSGDDQRPDKVADKLDVDCDLDAPPEKVWRALSEPELVAAWLTDGDIGDTVEIEVLAVEPGRQITYAWREAARESVVTFAVTQTASGGAHLRLVHEYFGDMMLISPPVGLPRAGSREISIVSPKYPHRRVRDRHRVPGMILTTMRWAA